LRRFAGTAALLRRVGVNDYGLSWHLDGDKARTQTSTTVQSRARARYACRARPSTLLDVGVYHDSGRILPCSRRRHPLARDAERATRLALVVFNSKTYNGGNTFVAPLRWQPGNFRSVT